MAENPVDLAQVITINNRNLQDVDIPNFLNNAPFMRTNAASIASYDTLHEYLQYVNPASGFREPNDGREVQSSTDTKRQIQCKILDASFRVDLALAQSYRKGGSSGMMNREAARNLDDAFFKAEVQVFNGRATALNDPDDATYFGDTGTGLGDDTGFNGFPNYATMGSLAGGQIVNAGGTANRESIYVVRSGMMDVEIITGRSGDISIGDTTVQETAGTTGTYPALYTPVTAWYALKVGSEVSSCVRICNVDVTGGTGTPVDDDLIYSAIAKFGAGRQPTHIYMSRAMLEGLRKSRTATNPSGDPAPRPTNVEGIPIIQTDGINPTGAGEAAVA